MNRGEDDADNAEQPQCLDQHADTESHCCYNSNNGSSCKWPIEKRIRKFWAGLRRSGSIANNSEEVANLLCAQVHSACYPQRDGK